MSKFTPAFYRWFGDSVVVDEKRNPLVVYYGTNADFKKFDLSKSGSRFAEHKTDGAMWFSESPDEANGYVDSVASGNVMPCYLKMENPAVVDAAKTVQSDLYVKLPGGKNVYEIRYIKKRVVQYAKEDGHDGVIFLNGYDNVPSIGALFAVFKANQIKSAIGNDGSWDADDEDVRSNPQTYLSIGHSSGGVLWIWRNGKLDTYRAHDVAHVRVWGDAKNSWRGRYDPIDKTVSIQPPEHGVNHIPPEEMIESLTNEFDVESLVEF